MINSVILDVAIGMIFIYLLLSLMCSAAHEIIELLLKKRAIDLEEGIREMLNPGSSASRSAGSPDIVRDLYNHPLINGLFEGSYEGSRIANKTSWVRRTLLPSYIPARNFALAVMDLVVAGGGANGQASGAAGATGDSPGSEIPPQTVVNVGGVAAQAQIPPAPEVPDAAVVALRNALRDGAPNPTAQDAGEATNTRQIPDQMRRALIPLVDAAGNDITKVRENIENWFNASMERVSGWYKRRSQITLIILGLFVAITVNVDTITVVKRLSTDKALRESLVAASDAYAKANAAASSAAVTAPAKTTSPSESSAKRATDRQKACEEPTSAACQRAKDLDDACKVEDSARCKYAINQQQLESLGLPIGWDEKSDSKRNFTGWISKDGGGGLWDQFKWHWLGWLLTALAISLGAPFWFDLLNRFIAIRSAVKPKEKSP